MHPIYNEPKNAFVADFIGESNIFNGIMTDKRKVRFCGAEFECLDDVPKGTHIDAVVRPEDVIVTTEAEGAIKGEVISVVFKGVHYEITVVSGKNEIVIQSTKSAQVGSRVGLNIEPDGIHIMIAEHTLNKIESAVMFEKDSYYLEFLDGTIPVDLTDFYPKSVMAEDGTMKDMHGDVINTDAVRVILAVKPEDIKMSDDIEEGQLVGRIINLIYKGDHYSYVVRTDMDEDFIVDDEYLWNMDDRVSLIIPVDKADLSLKK